MNHLTTPLSYDVGQRKAARRKIIEHARKLECDSYKAMMQKRRQLQASNRLATIAWHMTTEEVE